MSEKIRHKPAQPEYVERIAEALRETDRTPTEPTPTTNANIAKEREEITGRIAKETEDLNEARKALGLRPADTSNAIKALRAKEATLPGESENVSIEMANHALNNTADQIARLGSLLQKRIENNYNMLLEGTDARLLRQSATGMAGKHSFNERDQEQIVHWLESTARTLDKFGPVRHSGSVAEDAGNLRAIAACAREAAEQVRNLNSIESKDINAAVSRFRNALDSVEQIARKRAAAVDGYLRR